MKQIAARGALEGDLATTEACFSMNNPRSRGGGTLEKTFAAAHFRQLVDQEEIQHTQAPELSEHDLNAPCGQRLNRRIPDVEAKRTETGS